MNKLTNANMLASSFLLAAEEEERAAEERAAEERAAEERAAINQKLVVIRGKTTLLDDQLVELKKDKPDLYNRLLVLDTNNDTLVKVALATLDEFLIDKFVEKSPNSVEAQAITYARGMKAFVRSSGDDAQKKDFDFKFFRDAYLFAERQNLEPLKVVLQDIKISADRKNVADFFRYAGWLKDGDLLDSAIKKVKDSELAQRAEKLAEVKVGDEVLLQAIESLSAEFDYKYVPSAYLKNYRNVDSGWSAIVHGNQFPNEYRDVAIQNFKTYVEKYESADQAELARAVDEKLRSMDQTRLVDPNYEVPSAAMMREYNYKNPADYKKLYARFFDLGYVPQRYVPQQYAINFMTFAKREIEASESVKRKTTFDVTPAQKGSAPAAPPPAPAEDTVAPVRVSNVADAAHMIADSVVEDGLADADADGNVTDDVLVPPTSDYFELSDESDGSQHVKINGMDEGLIKNSRIDHFVGPDGAAVKIAEEDLKGYKLVVTENPRQPDSIGEGVEFTWGTDDVTKQKSWVYDGQRLLVYNETEFDVVKTVAAAETVDTTPAADDAPPPAAPPAAAPPAPDAPAAAPEPPEPEAAEAIEGSPDTMRVLNDLAKLGLMFNFDRVDKIRKKLQAKVAGEEGLGDNPTIDIAELNVRNGVAYLKIQYSDVIGRNVITREFAAESGKDVSLENSIGKLAPYGNDEISESDENKAAVKALFRDQIFGDFDGEGSKSADAAGMRKARAEQLAKQVLTEAARLTSLLEKRIAKDGKKVVSGMDEKLKAGYDGLEAALKVLNTGENNGLYREKKLTVIDEQIKTGRSRIGVGETTAATTTA